MSEKKPFCPEQFTSTKWDSAEEKAKWANAMASWIRRGFPEKGWKKYLYHHLSVHLYGHIAHYDQYGFYAEWFATMQLQLSWLEYASQGGTFGRGMGDPAWTWCDVELALSTWIRENDLINDYRHFCAFATEMKERALLSQLLSKYIPIAPVHQAENEPLQDTATAATTAPATQHRVASSHKLQKDKASLRYVSYSLFEEIESSSSSDVSDTRKDREHEPSTASFST